MAVMQGGGGGASGYVPQRAPVQQAPAQQGGVLSGLFGPQMMPMYAGLAFGGTRQDQGRLAMQGMMGARQLAQQQAEQSALERYRQQQLEMQRRSMAAQGRASPLTKMAKLNADLAAGFITEEEYAAARNNLLQGSRPSGGLYGELSSIAQAVRDGLMTPEEAEAVRQRAIQGDDGVKPVPGEIAGRTALASVAKRSLSDAEEFYLGDSGVFEGVASDAKDYDALDRVRDIRLPFIGRPLSGGESGRARRSVQLAVEAALRLSTGAAAPESEVDRYTDLFAPEPTDTRETRRQKLAMLRDFIETAERYALQGRGMRPSSPAAQVSSGQQSAPESGGRAERFRYNPGTGEFE